MFNNQYIIRKVPKSIYGTFKQQLNKIALKHTISVLVYLHFNSLLNISLSFIHQPSGARISAQSSTGNIAQCHRNMDVRGLKTDVALCHEVG